jgi:hypothetical protein
MATSHAAACAEGGGGGSMTIAIDYDGTWTRDTHLWMWFSTEAIKAGHKVLMVTGRPESQPVNSPLRTIYTNGKLKESACRKLGIKVDVWIDDMPGMIQDCMILADNIGNEP